jgi:hypothetical protein
MVPQVHMVRNTSKLDPLVAQYAKLAQQCTDLIDNYISLKRRGKPLKPKKASGGGGGGRLHRSYAVATCRSSAWSCGSCEVMLPPGIHLLPASACAWGWYVARTAWPSDRSLVHDTSSCRPCCCPCLCCR